MNDKNHSLFSLENPFFSLLARNNQEALIILDDTRHIIFFNPVAEKLFSLGRNDVQGMHLETFCRRTHFNLPLDNHGLVSGTKTITITYPGNQLRLSWLIELIDVDGKTFIALLTTNLGENEKQNEIIRLETLIENMPCNIYWVDKDCLMLGCNHNVLSMLNMTREQFRGKTYEELSAICHWPEGLAEKLKNDDLHVMQTGQPIFGEEDPPIPHADNTVSNFLTSRVPLHNDAGEIVGIAGISMDITNLKLAREQAEIANQAKTDFIANMSHDIRTPLSGIIGMSAMLAEADINNQEKQYARWINESGEQLLKLLNGVLDVVSAGHANADDVHAESFHLKQCLEDIRQLEQPAMAKKGLDFYAEIAADIPEYIVTDRIKLSRILLNLIGNAIKFTDKGYIKVEILSQESQHQGPRLLFRVSDTGKGIPQEVQNKIFERFYRASPSYKNEHHGHGVGLHIAERYVELLGGEINLMSKPGSNTVFYFSIPLVAGTGDLAAEGLTPGELTFATGKDNVLAVSHGAALPHVLLVEDSFIALKVLENIAVQAGCRFTSAFTGEEGLALAKAQHFDFIVSDIGLPGISGNDMTRQIREWEKSCSSGLNPVPIFGLTGHGLQMAEQASLNAGMNQVFTKPMQQGVFEKLVQSINRHDEQKKIDSGRLDHANNLLHLQQYPLVNVAEAIKNIGDEMIVRVILESMLQEELPQGLQAMKQAYTEKNWMRLESLAHKMKGGAVYICATRLKWACQHLESYYKSGETERLDALYQQLIGVVEDTLARISQLEHS